MSPRQPILPPATLGMLGGGQLGRYFVMAARTMGYRTLVWEPDPHAPAGSVADEHITAAYDDEAVADDIARRCAVVTTEFENPPASTLDRLAQRVLVAPSPHAVAIAQDRIREKAYLTSIDCPVGPHHVLATADDLAHCRVSFPAVVKTARLGYDGKGQVIVTTTGEVAEAWDSLGCVPCVVEQLLPLDAEISVVLARAMSGEVATFAPTTNVHEGGILSVSAAPARGPLASAATDLAVHIAQSLDYVGVLGVEFFVVDDQLLVNELAPRPHNSGHWTLDAARTSQFEQQVRAVCGLGLGDPAMSVPGVAMVNLLGDAWQHGQPDWSVVLADPGAHLHLYGKADARPGRKMGHLTVTGDDAPGSARRALALRAEATTTT